MDASLSRYLSICLLIALLAVPTFQICDDKEVFVIGNNNKARCINCPNNCSVCYRGLANTPVCVSCSEGFYLDLNDECKPCDQNCSTCIGPNIEDCRSLKSGFFFNMDANTSESCSDPNCSQCYSKDKCKSCKEGFYAEKVNNTDKELAVVNCLPCGIDNCRYCDKKVDEALKTDYLTCNVCFDEYGIVSGKCENCPDNCQSCQEQSNECNMCKKGYFLDKETGKCVDVTIKNCYSMSDSQKCSYCESHYFLKDNECKLCRDEVDNCSFCALKDTSVVCLSCEIGYHRNDKNKCEKCIENCNHCSTDKCVVCRHGYFYEEQKDTCEKCELEHCKVCDSAEVCSECESGFFFNAEIKKCEKCAENCLKCSDNADNCLACPINYYSLQDQVVTKEKAEDSFISGVLSMFLGMKFNMADMQVMQIKTVNKCVKKCPKSYKDKEVLVNDAERKCTLKVVDGPIESLIVPTIREAPDVLTSLMSLKTQYDEEIRNNEIKAAVVPNESRNKECNYNGILKKEIRGNYESYYICRCDKEYLGDNCQITSTLYEGIQNKLVDIIGEVEKRFMNNDKHSEKIFLKSFILINKFKIGRSLIEKMTDLVRTFLQKDKDLDNKKKLYILYDSLLLNLFDISEDLKKQPYYHYNLDWDIEKERNAVFEDIHVLLDMIESSLDDLDYSNSFLAQESNQYMAMDTFSYIVNEFRLSSYDLEQGITISNPNIDTSFNNVSNNQVVFKFYENVKIQESKHNIQIVNFAAPLFDDRMRDESNVLVSNVAYFKNIDPQSLHSLVTNGRAGIRSMKITFAMNFLPAYDDILRHMLCKAYNFANASLTKSGKAVEFDDDEQTVVCEFELDFEFQNYYFSAAIYK